MITALLGVLSPVIDKVLSFIPNPVEREKARLEYEMKMREQEAALLQAFMAADQGQVDINKVEAANSSLFVSGWRPCCGWVCVSGVAWTFVFKPVLDWGLAIWLPNVHSPVIESGELMSLLLGMLGMGALRSFEKVRGVNNK